ncbi:hypothetical protein M8C21_017248 [Ambrosia artemisiifolia]|uniref:Uncharacterized protein n=1 Tax=Ambrosia artemisiifolia TaxID=4212 RepID=A0AAD5GNC8_AMBAR|nr:hypothetical protein M8C21_017248 [Ambrosia artemisiifolia]
MALHYRSGGRCIFRRNCNSSPPKSREEHTIWRRYGVSVLMLPVQDYAGNGVYRRNQLSWPTAMDPPKVIRKKEKMLVSERRRRLRLLLLLL